MRNLQPFQGWRLTFFQGIMVAVFLLFAIRMYDLQILQYDFWRALADENRYSELPIAAERGVIYDRFGRPLAINAPAYVIYITPAELPTGDAERYAIYNRISALVNVPPTIDNEFVNGRRVRSIERMVNEGEGVAPFRPVPIAADIERRVAIRLREEEIELPGVQVDLVAVREYPTGPLTAHVVGYMGPIGPEESERLQALGYNPAFDRVGYDGVEAYLEPQLAGQRGSILREVDVAGEEIQRIRFTPSQAGYSVSLTIDVELQAIAQQALLDQLEIINTAELQANQRIRSNQGIVIALDPRTGEILALVSYPSYDNSRFARAIDGEYYLEILNADDNPLVNHTIGALYAPGSAWKLITAAGVLQEDVIDPTQTLFDPGSLLVENRFAPNDAAAAQRFVCHVRDGHGNLNMVGAIAQSCNVYFYQVGGGNPSISEFALRPGGLGIDNLIRYSTALGIGSETGVQLPGEIAGRMPDRNWKRIVHGENWSTGDTYNAAFGQGYITVTPLQMIMSVQGIVNGTLYQPTLVREFLDQEGNPISPFQPIVSRTLNLQQPNEDGTITLQILEDMIIKGESSLACMCERDSRFYNPLRCNPDAYRNTVDIASGLPVEERQYRVHVPFGYTFNGRVCNPSRFNANFVPAFLSEESLAIVRLGMRKTVEVGTAQAANLSLVRYDGIPVTVAGKTGTAEYCDDIAWARALCEQGNWPAHAWFTAYAPYEAPEILVIAMVYNGDEGSLVALPIVNKVIEGYFNLQTERLRTGEIAQLP
ncbi:MAG: penicillin-binding transpeptidase domain-containing protein [Anaerolineae bacterium]|nr:penicillin-binding transpeptidase domain-containing protein [Anaerolineae bacterium]